LYQKQCGVEKRRGREIAEAKLGGRRGEERHDNIPYYRKNLNNRTMCYVVRNFLLWKRGEKHTKNLPAETEGKRKKHQTILREESPTS